MAHAETVEAAEWTDHGIIGRIEIPPSSDYAFIATDDGVGFGVPMKYRPDRIKVGQRAYTTGGFGFPIQGVRVDDEVVFFKSPAEMEADREAMLAKFSADRIADFERNKDRWMTAMRGLPPPLKARMERFCAEHGGFTALFRDDGGGFYELFCCTEAVKFADYFRPRLAGKTEAEAEEEIRAFRALPYEQQRQLVPFDDGHSGNTFGGAVMLGARVALGLDV